MRIDEVFERYVPALEQEMQAILRTEAAEPSPDVEPLYGMLRYHLGWADENLRPANAASGKRIRPVLCLLSCEACGGDFRQALSIAAAIELIHNFTLIHDDIQDRSQRRRHRPCVWTLWGEAQAINAGDALYSIASLAPYRSIACGVPAETVLFATRSLHSTLLSVCEGQYMDVAFEERTDVTPELYLAMIKRKTASLVACSTHLGAYIATGDDVVAGNFREFGHALGMAFQIQDDILGIWGDPAVTGKPVGDDIYQRKKTLPIVYGLEVGEVMERLRLEQILACPKVTVAEVEEATTILSRLGAREYAIQSAQKWFDLALGALSRANPREPGGTALKGLAASLIGRTF